MPEGNKNTHIDSSRSGEIARKLSVISYITSACLVGFFVYISYGGLIDGSVGISRELFVITAVLAVVVAAAHGWLLYFYHRLWGIRLMGIVILLVMALLAYGLTGLSLEGRIVW